MRAAMPLNHALEEKLTCKAGNPFDEIEARYPDVAEFQEQLD